MTIVVGVDGAGRTYRLGQIAAAAEVPVLWVTGPHGLPAAVSQELADAAPGDCLVAVDDPHHLPDQVLQELTAVARRGVRMVVARRPTLDRPALAALDQAVAAQGPVESLTPLTDDVLTALLTEATGRPASPEAVRALRTASAGYPAWARLVAAGDSAEPVAALVARVQQRLALLAPPLADVARILAFTLDLTDSALATAAGLPTAQLAPAVRALRDAGLLLPDGERLVPAVAQAILAELAPVERRRLLDAVANALVDTGGDPVAAAAQLSAARARTRSAARIYRAAADQLRFVDPAAALAWYDDALDAGAASGELAAGRAEATALLGRPVEVEYASPASGADAARVGLATGAAAAHQGRAVRSAEALLAADPPGPLLAVPALVAVGKLAEARAAAGTDGPAALRRFAEGALAAVARTDPATEDPAAAVALLIEAAEAMAAAPPAVVLPDTPHALGALVAVLAGDAASAEHLLRLALDRALGGPVATERHRLLLAWARMRAGRYDTALTELRQLADRPLPGRERLLAAALAAGIARRSGDVAQLREAWLTAEPVLARRAVDLFQIEQVEELVVAAARLRAPQHATPVLETLARVVTGLGDPTPWAVALDWARLQVAVAVEDPAGAAAAATALRVRTPDPVLAPRQHAQCAAAGPWARALAGEPDPDEVLAAVNQLAAAHLPWEASRLAGHAAIRTGEPAAARRLLERARELSHSDPTAVADRPESGLSAREREVGRLVLEGRTYREIGAQLHLSPKTVEHHVARIRTKLGADSRAELLAALRRALSQ